MHNIVYPLTISSYLITLYSINIILENTFSNIVNIRITDCQNVRNTATG